MPKKVTKAASNNALSTVESITNNRRRRIRSALGAKRSWEAGCYHVNSYEVHAVTSRRFAELVKAVANTEDGFEREGIIEFLAQLTHVYIHGSFIAVPAHAPHAIE